MHDSKKCIEMSKSHSRSLYVWDEQVSADIESYLAGHHLVASNYVERVRLILNNKAEVVWDYEHPRTFVKELYGLTLEVRRREREQSDVRPCCSSALMWVEPTLIARSAWMWLQIVSTCMILLYSVTSNTICVKNNISAITVSLPIPIGVAQPSDNANVFLMCFLGVVGLLCAVIKIIMTRRLKAKSELYLLLATVFVFIVHIRVFPWILVVHMVPLLLMASRSYALPNRNVLGACMHMTTAVLWTVYWYTEWQALSDRASTGVWIVIQYMILLSQLQTFNAPGDNISHFFA